MKEHKSYEKILKYLSKGEENATSLNELSTVCGYSERDTKHEVLRARKDGVIICSNAHGYFYPDSINDVWLFYKRYHASAMTTLTMLKHARAELVKNGIDPKG